VLLHGYPTNHLSWRHQTPTLAATHRVIAPDLLGWGESDRPLELRFDYESERDRIGRLLDALGIERCSLVGHDYGGFLALGYVQANPDRVRRFAILNSRAHATFVPRWYATFALITLIGRTPGIRALAARLPLGGLNRRGLAAVVKRGHLDAEELAARIPGAELTMLDGTGHFVMEERPAEVTAALQRLLER
jgi:pimeloyl-ACP methyl ester carboxylesterase